MRSQLTILFHARLTGVSVTNIDELPFDELASHWRRKMLRTEPINEGRARRAIENLTIAITGRAPRAVFFFSSPIAAQLAARTIKVDLVEEGLERLLLVMAEGGRSRLPDVSTEGGRQRALLEDAVAKLHRSTLASAVFLAFRRLWDLDADDPQISAARTRTAWKTLRKQCASRPYDQGLGLLRRKGKCPPRASRRRPLDEPLPISALYGLYAKDSAARRPDAGTGSWMMPSTLQHALGDVLEECSMFWLFPEVAVVVDRPELLSVDGEGALHSEVGPAVRFRDGEVLYAAHGVAVPDHVFESPESLTADEIDDQDNAEVRRVMIDSMGRQRYLELAGARRVHEDETGVLWRRGVVVESHVSGRHRSILRHTRAIAFVEVVNGTAGPDGTFNRYFLRVPPNMQTAREAVAWTYGLSAAEYVPVRRT